MRWGARSQRTGRWGRCLTLSCSLLPLLLLALVALEIVKLLTFPHLWRSDRPSSALPETTIRATGYEAHGSQWDVMDCINQNQESYRATTWASAMSPRSASLMVVGIWWSAKPASIPLTVTTQMSAARLWQLKALCVHYPGPVSAVLYVGVLKGRVLHENGLLAFIVRQAEALFHSMEKAGQCKLDLMLVREVFDDADAKIWYPVNQLRNYARLQVRTPLMAIVDADLLVSSVLVEEMRTEAAQYKYLQQLVVRQDKAVYVLPAFQVPNAVPREEAMTLADRAVELSKEQLEAWYGQRHVVPFDPGKPGHAATNYTRWFSTREQYAIQYELRYEPWVFCDRRSVPWHDNMFKGYGLNKIMHLEHMNSTGYKFLVHPSAFLVHRAHRSTKAKRLVLTAKMAQQAKSPALPLHHSTELEEEEARGAGEGKDGSWAHAALTGDQVIDEEEGLVTGRREKRRRLAAGGRKDVGEGNGGGGQGRRLLALDEFMDEDFPEGDDAAGEEQRGRRLLADDEEEDTGASGEERQRRRLLADSQSASSTYAYTQRLGEEVRARIRAGTYEPRVDRALEVCLKQLSWWKQR